VSAHILFVFCAFLPCYGKQSKKGPTFSEGPALIYLMLDISSAECTLKENNVCIIQIYLVSCISVISLRSFMVWEKKLLDAMIVKWIHHTIGLNFSSGFNVQPRYRSR
jgi:hypothetical protein